MSLAAPLAPPAFSPSRGLPHRVGVVALAVLAALLFMAPRLGLKLGPVPLYGVDGAAAILVLCALLTPGHGARLPASFMALMVFIVLGEFCGGVAAGAVLESVYAAGRLVLALSLAYGVAALVREPFNLMPVLKAATLGILLTSALMVLSSLPATRGVVADLFSHPMLEPAALRTQQHLADTDGGIRGRSLIGVSIVSATVLNVALPFAALLAGMVRGLWRLLATLAILAAPLGVTVSYSRSAYLGLLLVVAGFVVMGLYGRRMLLGVLALGIVALAAVGPTDALLLSRLETRITAMVQNPLANEREHERLLAYVEPFQHVMHHPRFLLLGEGSVAQRFGTAHQSQKATHAVFAKAYYGFGLVAAVLFAALPVLLLARIRRLRLRLQREESARSGRPRTEPFTGALMVAALPFIPYFLFDHGAISAPASLMLLALLFALSAPRLQQPMGRRP